MAKVAAEKLTGEFVKDIINKVGLKAQVSVEEDKEEIKVNIEGEQLGALIGYHGETLESLQLLTSLYVNRKNQEEVWKRVSIDIGNWKNERKEVLRSMIEKGIRELETSKTEKVTLPSMSSSQRREIHVLVNENYPELLSESEGEEPNRRVVISRK